MLEHSNRRSRFSFFNIEMMEPSDIENRPGAVAEGIARAEGGRARRRPFFSREATPLREKLGGSEQGKAGDRGKRRLRGDGAEGPRPEGGRRSLCLYIGS